MSNKVKAEQSQQPAPTLTLKRVYMVFAIMAAMVVVIEFFQRNLSEHNMVINLLSTEHQFATTTVYYYANGGIDAPKGFQIKKDGSGVIIFYHSPEVPFRKGYRFLGWRKNNDRNFCIDDPMQRIEFGLMNPNENSKFKYYAQWEEECQSIFN